MDKIIGVNWCKFSADLFVSQLLHLLRPFSPLTPLSRNYLYSGTKRIFEIVEPCEGNLNPKKPKRLWPRIMKLAKKEEDLATTILHNRVFPTWILKNIQSM